MSSNKLVEFVKTVVEDNSFSAYPAFYSVEPKPSVGYIPYKESNSIYYMGERGGRGSRVLTSKMDNDEGVDVNLLINDWINRNNVDLTKSAQEIVREALKNIARTSPSIGKVLFKFAIHPDKRVPTMGVGYNDEDGRFHLSYNPRFTIYFALKAAISKFSERDNKQELLSGTKAVTFEELVLPIKFVLIHEAFHVIKAHQSAKRGVHVVSTIENLVYDSQINTQLARFMGNEVPQNILKEAVKEGIFITLPSSLQKLDEYSLVGKDEQSYNPIAVKIAKMTHDLLNAQGVKVSQVKYIYLNVDKLFSTWTPDQVIEGITYFEEFATSGKITQKPNDLPDVIKDALRELANSDALDKKKFKDGDIGVYQVHNYGFSTLPVEIKKVISEGRKTSVVFEFALLPKASLPSSAGSPTRKISVHRITKPEIKVLYPGDLINLYEDGSNSTFVVGKMTKDFGAGSNKKIINAAYEVFKFDKEGMQRQVRGFDVSKIVSDKQTIFVGNRVAVKAIGATGVVVDADYLSNIYTVDMSSDENSSVSNTDRYNYDDLRLLELKKLAFGTGDYVEILGQGKVGKVVQIPDAPEGTYKVEVVPETVWNQIIKGEVNDQEEFSVNEFLELSEGEMSKLEIPNPNAPETPGESQPGESEPGEGASSPSAGGDPDGEGEGEGSPSESPSLPTPSEETLEEGGGSEGSDPPDTPPPSSSSEGSDTTPGTGIGGRDLESLVKEVESILSSENVEEAANQVLEEDKEIEATQREIDKKSGINSPGLSGTSKPSQPDQFKELDIPSNLSADIDSLVKRSSVKKLNWRAILSKLISEITGIKIISNDQLISRRIPGAFGAEEDVPHYRSVLIMFDVSGSMKFQQSVKSLKIIDQFFKQPAFKNVVVWIAHYNRSVKFSKLRKYKKSRFNERAKAGFTGGGTASLSEQLLPVLKKVRPLPDFIINLTDGEFSVGDIKDNAKVYRLVKRSIFVIVGKSSEKNNRAYKNIDARFKKRFILGAKSS